MNDAATRVRNELRESARVLESFSEELAGKIAHAAEMSASAIREGRKIVFFGNGGSAAQAQHLAAELVVRLERNRRALASIALTTDTSILTAAGNDLGFEQIFSRQIEALISEKDVLFALSTSGNSPNVLRALEAGRAQRAVVIGMTGETGGKTADKVDLLLNVPSRSPQRIQEAHLAIGHIICGIVEERCCSAGKHQ